MSHFSTRMQMALRLFSLLLPVFALVCAIATPTLGQEEKFKVGDIVEFEFLGQTLRGEVTRFTGTGWPYVQFEYRGRSMERFRPPGQLTLVDSVDAAPKNAAGMSKLRTWTDATGEFTLKAKLLSHKNGKVELEKEDGRVITLPAVQLSESDQAFLKETEDDTNEKNRFAGGEMKSKPVAKSDGRVVTVPKSPVAPAITPAATANEIVLTENGWLVVPAAAGNVMGRLETAEPFELMAFSQDGQYLAGLRESSGEIKVWDLDSGDLVQEFAISGGVGSSIVWVGEKYLLVNGTDLMDVELRSTVWRYRPSAGGSVQMVEQCFSARLDCDPS